MKKPVRKARRFIKRSVGRINGKGKQRYDAVASMDEDQYDKAFFGGTGKSKGARPTSGKGKGRRGNRIGSDGEVMKCSICNSTDHFKAVCPRICGVVLGGCDEYIDLWGGFTNTDAPTPAIDDDEDEGPLAHLFPSKQVKTKAFSNIEQQDLAPNYEPHPTPQFVTEAIPHFDAESILH